MPDTYLWVLDTPEQVAAHTFTSYGEVCTSRAVADAMFDVLPRLGKEVAAEGLSIDGYTLRRVNVTDALRRLHTLESPSHTTP